MNSFGLEEASVQGNSNVVNQQISSENKGNSSVKVQGISNLKHSANDTYEKFQTISFDDSKPSQLMGKVAGTTESPRKYVETDHIEIDLTLASSSDQDEDQESLHAVENSSEYKGNQKRQQESIEQDMVPMKRQKMGNDMVEDRIVANSSDRTKQAASDSLQSGANLSEVEETGESNKAISVPIKQMEDDVIEETKDYQSKIDDNDTLSVSSKHVDVSESFVAQERAESKMEERVSNEIIDANLLLEKLSCTLDPVPDVTSLPKLDRNDEYFLEAVLQIDEDSDENWQHDDWAGNLNFIDKEIILNKDKVKENPSVRKKSLTFLELVIEDAYNKNDATTNGFRGIFLLFCRIFHMKVR